MLSVQTSEGWRAIDPFDIVTVYRGDDDPRGMYVSAVFVMHGGEEIAGMVRADALARIKALISDDMTPPPVAA